MLNKGIKNRFFRMTMVIYFLFPVIVFSQKHYNINKKYSPAALKQDAMLVKDVVLKMHPAIGIYQPKTYYENLFDRLISGLKDSLTEKQFRVRLKLVLDELHCGHTEVMYSRAFSKAIKPMKLNFLPYYVVTVNNKLFTVMPVNRKKDSLIKQGSEVLKINGIPSDTILNFSRKMISADGYVATGKNLAMRTFVNYIYPSLFGRPDTFLIETKRNDTIKKYCVSACNLKDLPFLPIGLREDSLLRKHRRANMSEGYVDSAQKLFVLKIRSFRSTHYKKVYRKVFRTLRKNKTENLVIDLRNNGGGNLENCYRLMKYVQDKEQTVTLRSHVKNFPDKKYAAGNLGFRFTKHVLKTFGTKKADGDTAWFTEKVKPYKKQHYGGKIFVLINGGTFSASCIVAAYLKESKRAILIGTETGGTNEGCNAGITPNYILPNTKLKVRIPAFRIIHDINPAYTGRGIIPDHEINYSFEDILKRRDLEMKFVKESILK
jgi:hypothetical protein